MPLYSEGQPGAYSRAIRLSGCRPGDRRHSTTPLRRPKQAAKRDKTIMVTDDETPWLLRSIGTSTVMPIRDAKLIGVTAFAFARVSERCGAPIANDML
jgi:hypothetical protein